MARPQSSPILAQLHSAKTFPEQTAALKALKNEIVGHAQKKEEWIRVGILEPIVTSLSGGRPPAKLNGKDAGAVADFRPLSEEDAVKLQSLQLLASFANGGPSFLPPLEAALAIPAILNNISPANNPSQIVTAALKSLLNIADAALLAPASTTCDIQTIADRVFTPQHIESLGTMIALSTAPKAAPQAITQNKLATGLVCRLCKEERHQQALAAGGVLDLLASQLAGFVVRDGYVVPGAEGIAGQDSISEAFPAAARKSASIGPVLEAIGAILGDSKYRATRFINSPSILAVFPSVRAEHFSRIGISSGQDMDNMDTDVFRHKWMTAMEYILPAVIIPQTRSASHSPHSTPDYSDSHSKSRAPLSKSNSGTVDSTRFPAPGHSGSYPAADIESPLIPWLVYLVRSSGEYERLVALSVLTSLFRAGLCMTSTRETTLGLLVVPILVEMISRNDKEGKDADGPEATTQQLVLERAPAILARLITDCEYLQKAAYECDAVKVLTRLLKNVYQPVDATDQSQYWSPYADTSMEVEATSPQYQLGEPGQNSLLAHRIRTRESALKAVGALAASKEDYRKALVAEDFIPYVVESLTEYPGRARQAADRAKEKPGTEPARTSPNPAYGTNPISVIIAACFVVRMLSRSVHTSRTALIDHGVAAPILNFMRHSDVNVQIAATGTVINLVVAVNPAKEYLTENGVMKVLCEHAHSPNPALRLNALWALKHFVDGVSPSLKKTCLEQLEPGFLLQLISDEEPDSSMYVAKYSSQAGDDLDEDMDAPQLDAPVRWIYTARGVIHELDGGNSSKLRQVEDYLTAVRESELNPARKARNDDLAIQEQGIDFIRNLIGQPEQTPGTESTAQNTEVIDYLFGALGQDRLFEILSSKLRAKVLHPFSRRSSSGRETKVFHPLARIIAVVIYILVHISASGSRYRQLVISQTELLKLLAQQTSSKDREVRVALCHLLLNLTWKDSEAESQACAQRAIELKKLGFHTRMETLMRQEKDLDVRERAKMAAWQIDRSSF